MKSLKHILLFFSLLDRSGHLSITNVALLIILVKLVLMPVLSLPDVTVFMVVMLGYAHKRSEIGKAAARELLESKVPPQDIEAIKATVDQLNNQFLEVRELAIEAKSQMSKVQLANGFKPPQQK